MATARETQVEIDAEELLHRLCAGKEISVGERNEVCRCLGQLQISAPELTSFDELYSLILVARRAHILEAKPLIEYFLSCQEPQTVGLALETLCAEWGLLEEYREHLLRFSLGESWDEDGDVQSTAIKLLGELLHDWGKLSDKKAADKERLLKRKSIVDLLQQLIVDDAADSSVRKSSYYAMLRGAGRPWEDLPSELARLDFTPGSSDIEWKAIGLDHYSSSS